MKLLSFILGLVAFCGAVWLLSSNSVCQISSDKMEPVLEQPTETIEVDGSHTLQIATATFPLIYSEASCVDAGGTVIRTPNWKTL